MEQTETLQPIEITIDNKNTAKYIKKLEKDIERGKIIEFFETSDYYAYTLIDWEGNKNFYKIKKGKITPKATQIIKHLMTKANELDIKNKALKRLNGLNQTKLGALKKYMLEFIKNFYPTTVKFILLISFIPSLVSLATGTSFIELLFNIAFIIGSFELICTILATIIGTIKVNIDYNNQNFIENYETPINEEPQKKREKSKDLKQEILNKMKIAKTLINTLPKNQQRFYTQGLEEKTRIYLDTLEPKKNNEIELKLTNPDYQTIQFTIYLDNLIKELKENVYQEEYKNQILAIQNDSSKKRPFIRTRKKKGL